MSVAPTLLPSTVRALPRPLLVSWAVLIVLAIAAIIGLLIDPAPAPGCCVAGPSRDHLLGTTVGGVDLVAAVARGLSTSALICIAATAVALVFGALWGGMAAALPARLELIALRVVDVLAGAPYTLFVVTLVVMVRAARPSLPEALERALDTRVLLVVAVASIEWMTLARVVHTRLASLRSRPFIEMSRSLGVPRGTIFRRHVVPHTLGPLFAYGVLALPGALAAEGFFSFIGFGVEAPQMSLGTLIAEGVRAMSVAPLTFLLPASVLVAATVTLHIAGAHLRDALRPERS